MTLKEYSDFATRLKLGYEQIESVFPSKKVLGNISTIEEEQT